VFWLIVAVRCRARSLQFTVRTLWHLVNYKKCRCYYKAGQPLLEEVSSWAHSSDLGHHCRQKPRQVVAVQLIHRLFHQKIYPYCRIFHVRALCHSRCWQLPRYILHICTNIDCYTFNILDSRLTFILATILILWWIATYKFV